MIYHFVPAALRGLARKSPRLLSQCILLKNYFYFKSNEKVKNLTTLVVEPLQIRLITQRYFLTFMLLIGWARISARWLTRSRPSSRTYQTWQCILRMRTATQKSDNRGRCETCENGGKKPPGTRTTVHIKYGYYKWAYYKHAVVFAWLDLETS